MPVYRCNVRGESSPRLIRAASAAAARSSLVEASTCTAEEMADLLDKGVKLETSTAPADPVEDPPKQETREDPPKASAK